MPKVVLYDFESTLIRRPVSVGQARQLLFPTQTSLLFKEHIRKQNHVIVYASQNSLAEVQLALQTANIDITKIEILGSAETSDLAGISHDEKIGRKAYEEMRRRQLNAAVIVNDSFSIDASNREVVHILVPTDYTESDTWLYTTLLPASILKEQVKPQVEQIKESARRGGSISSLSKLYHRITNLFTVPASYEQTYDLVKRTAYLNPLVSQDNNGFQLGILLLRDYCKTTSKETSGSSLFFSGHWNRHHTDAVQKLINDPLHYAEKNPIQTHEELNERVTLKSLLLRLKSSLITAGNPLNPAGSLARRIEFMQSKAGISVIDIDDLNAEIVNNVTLANDELIERSAQLQ